MNKTKHVILISTLLLCFACTSGQNSVKSTESELLPKPKLQIADSSVKAKLTGSKTELSLIENDSVPARMNRAEIKRELSEKMSSVQQFDSVESDTNTVELKSSQSIEIPITQDATTKVVMVKEKSKVDFLRYLIPIFTLLLGIWIKEHLDKKNEKKKILKSGKRWIAELRSLEEPLNKQIEALNNFLDEHGTDDFSIPRIVFYSSLNGEIFKSLDKSELIQFIEIKKEGTDFNEIVKVSNQVHGYMSILIHLYESLKEKFNKYLSETSKYVDALNLSLQSFSVSFADYQVELETEIEADPINDERFKPIADLYSEHILPHLTDGEFNPFKLNNEFFMPVLEVLSKNRLDIRTKPMLIAVNAALNSIKGIEMEKRYMTDITNKMIGYYEKQLKDLEGTVNALNT